MNHVLECDLNRIAGNSKLFKSLEKKIVLVTGATGLLGSLIIRSMLKYNDNVTNKIEIIGIARNNSKVQEIFSTLLIEHSELQFCIQNITEEISIDSNVGYIIHTASITQSKDFIDFPVETIKTTVWGCERVLEFACRKKVKSFIYLSSLEVYGTPFESDKTSYFQENDFGYLNPSIIRSSYSESKRVAECLCMAYASEYNIPLKIARLTQTFGAGVSYDDNRVFAEFARCALENRNIILHTHGQTIRNYCYTVDAVNAIFTILNEGDEGEVYNIANKNTTISIYDMAKLVCELVDNKICVELNIDNRNRGYNPEVKLALNTNKLEQLKWTPRYSLKEMFQRLLDSWQCEYNE